ncbi:MAG: hypothetical protein BGO98_30735 [Myxococcales bacterium 68-20]|nr:MAG: hypothetical protein BGO98_30735 [Myxococcales bacterium 68-20]
MKLGLTTTSRSVPLPAIAPRESVAPALATNDAKTTLLAAPPRAKSESAVPPVSSDVMTAKEEPPQSSREPATRDGAPQSAVRRKARRPRSDRSMQKPSVSSRTSPLGRSGRGSGDEARTMDEKRDPAAASPRKKERNAVETKRRILEAAAAEFAAKGFDGTRLGSIARTAEVQQALIQRYFVDKDGLHAEVVRGGLTAMTEDAWALLSQMDAPIANRKGKKRRGPAELRAVAEAFVDLLLRFFVTNGAFLSILRHEARRDADGAGARKIVADDVAPVFDAIVARLDEMRARGEVRKDVDARHLVLSCVAMIAFPFQEEPFVASIWPVDCHRPEHLAERKKHVVEMILARVLP